MVERHGQVGQVGEEVQNLSAHGVNRHVRMDMAKAWQCKAVNEQESVIEGKDTQGAAHVEMPEIMPAALRILENTGDQKAGKNEEQIYAKHPVPDDGSVGPVDGRVRGKQASVCKEDKQDSQAAQTVESGKMSARARTAYLIVFQQFTPASEGAPTGAPSPDS